MDMYIDWETIMTAAKVVGAIGVLAGVVVAVFRFVESDKRQQTEIAAIKREQTVITVSNDGEPISKSSQEQLFVPFYTTKGTAGTGVGLSLCRQMVRMNGGTIKLTSSTPEATTFTIVV